MLLRVSEQSQNRGTPIIFAKSIALIKILSKLLANQKWLLRNHMGQWKDNKHQSSLHIGKLKYIGKFSTGIFDSYRDGVNYIPRLRRVKQWF